ncbi:MAG: UbiA prenyltransferase family protein [Clostridiales bacterium]|jgi:4-hydroxybenzoate polyprenyltransferase|nr:UbiA prenyltransferase family protein [Clostridiales bacterium]
MKNILAEIRIKHYIKNTLVFLPLVFSLNLTDTRQLGLSALVFAAFCFLSSGVYIVNDIADAARDRLHPDKKHRPIASGAMSVKSGITLASGCFALFAAFAVIITVLSGPVPAVLLLSYAVINICYSFILKHYAIIDCFCVMAGFILRIEAGAAAIGVPVSNWLLLTIMSLSLYLGFGKRSGELGEAGGTRDVLAKYGAAFLDQALGSMMTLSIAFYALWSIDADTAARLGTDKMVWTVPLVAAGLLRYAMKAGGSAGDPVSVILADKPTWVIMICYVCASVGIIYLL